MIRHIFNTEIKRLYRDSGVATVSLLVAILLIFALANGASYTEKRSNNISAALNEQQLDDDQTKQKLDSVQRGLITGLDSWVNPETPSYIANRKARVAAMPANEFSLISTGQSDIYAFYVKPTFSSESYMLSFSELANPVQLLFGNFDLAFAIVYLLPLIAIALSYNILSEEKEYGSYRLLASQPISEVAWLLVRTLTRAIFLMVVVVGSMLLGFALFGNGVFSQPLQLLQLMSITAIYLLFWFAASFVVNYFSAVSGTNAIRLVTVWAVFVLMMPSVIHQLASSIYVVPSRALMVNEVREAKADASKKADAILKSYYRDHPELAPADSTQKNPYSYWVSYIASQELIKKQLEPIVNDFDTQLAAQQKWVEKLRIISPALLVQNSLHTLAGTSTAHYADYRKQVVSFADEWKAFFAPKFFAGEKMTVGDLESLPAFTYNERVTNPLRADVTGLLIYSLFTFLFGLLMYRYGRGHRSIDGSPA